MSDTRKCHCCGKETTSYDMDDMYACGDCRDRAAPLRWTTTPPGSEHEGRWFWVRRHPYHGENEKALAKLVSYGWAIPDWSVVSTISPAASLGYEWAGPIEEPENGGKG